MIANS